MAALRLAALAAWLLAAACAAPMQPPQDFVELRDAGEGWRAVTSDGGRLRVRDLAEPTTAGVGFWADSLRLDLLQRGYEHAGDGEVKNADGAAGRWLEFTANVRGERVGYLVALWFVEPWLGSPYVRVVEFAARDDVFRAHADAVRAALATVRG
jgi:hypothetical protein